jgi:sulfatase modifying factor 1
VLCTCSIACIPCSKKLLSKGCFHTLIFRVNIWQGEFPNINTAEDGYVGTCPVTEFPTNAFHLHNIVGNVWEWTADWWNVKHTNTPIVDPVGYIMLSICLSVLNLPVFQHLAALVTPQLLAGHIMPVLRNMMWKI